MTAYLDTSVVLRLVLGEPDPLAGWRDLDRAVTSVLTEVECLRTLDRLARSGALTDADAASRRVAVYSMLDAVERVGITEPILRRASQAFPVPLGTLDALRLATAMTWRDVRSMPLAMATHDRTLALAARAIGFDVIGARAPGADQGGGVVDPATRMNRRSRTRPAWMRYPVMRPRPSRSIS